MIMMAKKIGNSFLILIFLFFNFSLSTSIELKVKDFKGNDLSTVGIGIPFVLEIVIEGKTFETSKPIIENLDQYLKSNLEVSSTARSFNGNMSIKKTYRYELRIDKEGRYKIGPAKIDINGQTFNSASIIVNVEKDQKNKSNEKVNSQKAFVKIGVDKKRVFEHQQIRLNVKFYFLNDVIFHNLEAPELKNFSINKANSTSSGTEEIEGKIYSYNEWNFIIFPQKTGELIIPAFKANFSFPTQFNDFFSFFGASPDQRDEVLSNSIKILVDQIPLHNGTINGVGFFKNFIATVNQNEAIEGEGIVLKIEIEGDGDLEKLILSDLNLPESMKYYDSKSYIESIDDKSLQKKIFEFIVQCNKSGEFTIPSQEFNFFNPGNKYFKSLKTSPIILKIKPQEKNLIPTNKNENVKSPEINDELKIYTVFEKHKNETSIPKNLLIFLLLIPLIFKVIFWFSNRYFDKKKYEIKKLQKKLFKLQKTNNFPVLYNFFIDYFSILFNVNHSAISDEFIYEKLMENFSVEIIYEWQIFFSIIKELSFYHKEFNNPKIFVDAQRWFDIFKKIS